MVQKGPSTSRTYQTRQGTLLCHLKRARSEKLACYKWTIEKTYLDASESVWNWEAEKTFRKLNDEGGLVHHQTGEVVAAGKRASDDSEGVP